MKVEKRNAQKNERKKEITEEQTIWKMNKSNIFMRVLIPNVYEICGIEMCILFPRIPLLSSVHSFDFFLSFVRSLLLPDDHTNINFTVMFT